MQESITDRPVAMQAMMIRGNSIAEIENIMERLSLTMQNGEVAEIANINSKTQVTRSFDFRLF